MMPIIRLPSVENSTKLSRASIYKLKKIGVFPPPINLTARAVAWLADEVDAWVKARVSGADDAECRRLIAKLVSERGQTLKSYQEN